MFLAKDKYAITAHFHIVSILFFAVLEQRLWRLRKRLRIYLFYSLLALGVMVSGISNDLPSERKKLVPSGEKRWNEFTDLSRRLVHRNFVQR